MNSILSSIVRKWKKWPFIKINPLVNAAMYSSLFRFRFRLIFRVGRAHQLILARLTLWYASLASSISEKTQLLAHFCSARTSFLRLPPTWALFGVLPAKLWEFHARPGCHGRANSKIRAVPLKKKSIINQSMKWNEDINKIIVSPAPWCMWQFFRRPARLQSATSPPTPVTSHTSPPSPPPPTPSRRRARISPPPTSAPPPPASRLPAPLSPARGRTRGTARACAASGRHTAGGVWAKRMVLWWTGSMKHPRRWRAFFTISALRPSTGQRCDL